MDSELTSNDTAVERQLRQLDQAVALSSVGGDLELLREVAALFLDDYPRQLDLIRGAATAGDPAGLENHAHSLKGSVSNFGAKEVFEAALALERKGRSGDLTGVEAGLRHLEQALEALKPELEAIGKQ